MAFNIKQILKFTLSSAAGFATDYLAYSALVYFCAPMGDASVPIANVLARIISATVNYLINRRFVFRYKTHAARTAAQYFALAGAILALNTCLLHWMVNSAGMDKYLAKLITEITFFTLSFVVQRFIIFRKKAKAA